MMNTLFVMLVEEENEKLDLQVYVDRLNLACQDPDVALVKH